MKKFIPQPIKNIYHLAQALLANFMHGFPARSIKVIGVTGTNGKTTTVQMIAKILEEAGKKVAMASTINFKIGEKEWVNQSKFTTLSSFKVQKFILDAVKAGCEYLVLETSSHSLDQYRVWGVKYATAVITNMTREHLDYHETMEEYRRAKLKLFKKAKTAIVNLDMEEPEEFLQFKNEKKIGYAASEKKIAANDQKVEIIKAENIELGTDSSRFTVNGSQFKINLIGEFNIENALAATCVGLSENISLEIIAKGLEKVKNIPGRMEYVPNNRGLNIIVDFALTPDSLGKMYALLKNINNQKGKIIGVLGSCGERDRGKRPIMGKIVSEYTDHIIITNEDPFHEDPAQIIREVAAGVPLCHPERTMSEQGESNGEPKDLMNKYEIPRQARDDIFCKTENVNFWIIPDRREAIKKALQIAKAGDFVVVTGKGHEDTMSVGDEKIPWNDKEVILKLLA